MITRYDYRYFHGTKELHDVFRVFSSSFRAIGGECNRRNGWQTLVGITAHGDCTLPVTRIVRYRKQPSLHKCDARCRNAKGPQCECACGGAFHGANN